MEKILENDGHTVSLLNELGNQEISVKSSKALPIVPTFYIDFCQIDLKLSSTTCKYNYDGFTPIGRKINDR